MMSLGAGEDAAALHRCAAVLAPTAADAAIAADVFRRAALPAVVYRSFEELCAAVERGVGAVVMMEEWFVHPQAQRLVDSLAHQPAWSSLPFVVLTRKAVGQTPPHIPVEILQNVVLLERPVSITSLLSATRAALGARSRQYEIRDLLEATRRAAAERELLQKAAEHAQATAEAANRMKDEFLAVLSHELRTPLNAILGWARLLRLGKLDTHQIARAIETIERNSTIQAQLIEDLLDVSRIISGTLRLKIEPLELTQVVEEALATVAPAANARGVRIHKDFDASLGLISGDPARLQQVVWNLLSNAVKFTPRDGEVWVYLRRMESCVEICVRDTGQGIAPEFLPHVFERFRQADSSTTRGHGGLGLGLAIVRQLVELHGGTVRAQSAGVNQGATFIVRLPLMLPTQMHTVPELSQNTIGFATSLEEAPSLEGMRILVVDDEPESLHFLTVTLSRYGAQVLTAVSAAQGLEAFTAHNPTLVISDIGMPREDGFSFMRKVRALEKDKGSITPAIALSAYTRMEDRAQALAAGFHVHLSKPVDPFDLVALAAELGRLKS